MRPTYRNQGRFLFQQLFLIAQVLVAQPQVLMVLAQVLVTLAQVLELLWVALHQRQL